MNVSDKQSEFDGPPAPLGNLGSIAAMVAVTDLLHGMGKRPSPWTADPAECNPVPTLDSERDACAGILRTIVT